MKRINLIANAFEGFENRLTLTLHKLISQKYCNSTKLKLLFCGGGVKDVCCGA
jgi:ubiquinone/menaquinone biosynthesis C-methylase UbiE